MSARRRATSRRTQVCRTPKDEAGMDHGTETGRVSQVRCAWSAQAVVARVLITFSRGAAGASRRTQVCRTPKDEAGMSHVAETG